MTLSRTKDSLGGWPCPWCRAAQQPSRSNCKTLKCIRRQNHGIYVAYVMYNTRRELRVHAICTVNVMPQFAAAISRCLFFLRTFQKCNKLLADFDPFKSFEVSIDARRVRLRLRQRHRRQLRLRLRCNLCQCQPALRAVAAAANKTN